MSTHGTDLLADWMTRRTLNRTELAELFGCDLSYITKLLNGTRQPGRDLSVKIEALTGIPVKAWASRELDNSDEPEAPIRQKAVLDTQDRS